MSNVVYFAPPVRHTQIRTPRNQNEAGISFHQWEERAQPLRPIWQDIAIGIVAGLIILPPVILYVLPFIFAVAAAVFGAGAQ